MDTKEYVQCVLKLKSGNYDKIRAHLSSAQTIDLLHAAMGMDTESGEFMDAMKKAIFYGKPVDRVNLVEELGDLMWYVALAAATLEVDLAEVMQKNVDKLKARYGGNLDFTETRALGRDLDRERKILEG